MMLAKRPWGANWQQSISKIMFLVQTLYLIPLGVSVGLETGKAASHIPGP